MAKSAELRFFDPEHVDRPVPARPWRALALISILVAVALSAGWELYWRAHWMEVRDFKNSTGLWAEQRRLAKGERTVLIGTSRMLFNIDLAAWQQGSGADRPIQLALEGTNPRPFLAELANDPNVTGLVVLDVTSAFLLPGGGRRANVLEYWKDESPFQRWDQKMWAESEYFLAYTDELTRPKRMLFLADLPLREGMRKRYDPPKVAVLGRDRDAKLWNRVLYDETYRTELKQIWIAMRQRLPKSISPSAVEQTMAEVKASIAKIRARGGDVAFVRFPYAQELSTLEDAVLSKALWDRIGPETSSAAIAFDDYPQLQGYELPEWSHLAPSERARYTSALVPLLYAEVDRMAKVRASLKAGE